MAENTMGSITIIFKKDDGGTEGTPTAPNEEGLVNSENPTVPNSSKSIAGVMVAAHIAKQSFNFMTSRVQEFTGDSRMQDGIDMSMKMLGYGAAIIANPMMGITALGLDAAMQAIDFAHKRKWENRLSAQLSARAGLVSDIEGR